MIELHDVHKAFGSIRAVAGVSLSIAPGEVVGLLGPNGAGKTTTVRMICSLIPPTGGSVSVDGLDSVDAGPAVRRRLGYLPESAPLPAEMRVRGYLRFRAALYAMSRRDRGGAIEHAIERCALGEVASRRIGTLSKGYRQRVGLAAALLHDPPVLILDEPTSGLDPAQIAETRALIAGLAGSRTAIIVSHNLPEVRATCERVVVFAHGRVRADARPEALVSASGSSRVAVELSGVEPITEPMLEGVRAITGVRVLVRDAGAGGRRFEIVCAPGDDAAVRRAVGEWAQAHGLTICELSSRSGSLESAYLALIESPTPFAGSSQASSGSV